MLEWVWIKLMIFHLVLFLITFRGSSHRSCDVIECPNLTCNYADSLLRKKIALPDNYYSGYVSVYIWKKMHRTEANIICLMISVTLINSVDHIQITVIQQAEWWHIFSGISHVVNPCWNPASFVNIPPKYIRCWTHINMTYSCSDHYATVSVR